MKLSKIISICFFFCLGIALVSISGWAQDYEAEDYQEYRTGQQESQAEISDSELATFAEIQSQFGKIQQNYKTKLSGVEDEARRQKLVEEMNEKMVKAVKDKGLSVERYNEIFSAIQANPDLQQKVNQLGGGR